MRDASLALILCAAVAGCAGVTRTVDKGTGALGELLLPVPEEVELGNRLAAEVNRQEKILQDPQVQKYANAVGQRIVKTSGDRRDGIRYSFTVIDEPGAINAFALPGGHIYVYSGLILAARNEAELSGVLAHEVGHVTSRHAAQALGTAYGLQALSAIALGKNPGALQQLAAGIAAQGYMARHSRDAEREADAKGLQYLTKAGYDPRAMPRFFEELVKISGRSNAVAEFFASHPNPRERVKNLNADISKMGKPSGKTSIVGGFDEVQARLRGGSSAPSAPPSGGETPPPGGTTPPPGGAPAPAPAPAPGKK
ncbi:MAG TPA: M48 family metallopeptidase [Vulgatibacter sp.]|nr:M48 family metallopeptidase [Vulgatibacter sp.]